jgi:hypothetical protein
MGRSLRTRHVTQPWILDQDAVLVGGGFVVNGTTHPDVTKNRGDFFKGVTFTRDGAGKWSFTLPEGVTLLWGTADPMPTADNADLYGQIDGDSDPKTGAYTVRTMTGNTATDPADLTYVGILLLVKCTARGAGSST